MVLRWLLVPSLLLATPLVVSAALLRPAVISALRHPAVKCRGDGESSSKNGTEEGLALPTKLVWFATEAFGEIAATLRGPAPVQPPMQPPPSSLDESIKRLAVDYEGQPDDPCASTARSLQRGTLACPPPWFSLTFARS